MQTVATRTGSLRRTRPRMPVLAVSLGLSLALAACGGGGADDAGGDGETWELRIATPLTAQEDQPQAIDAWAQSVEESTDGRVSLESFHGGQLLAAEEILPGLSDGRAEVGYIIDAFAPDQLPLWGSASLPFITLDPFAQAAAYSELYETNSDFASEFENAGVHILSFMATPAGAVASPDKIASVDELTGKRVRSFGYWAEALEDRNATPVFITTTEAFEAMERGVVDAIAPQGIETMVDRGIIEAAPNLLQTNVGTYVGIALAISLDTWNELPADVQDELQGAADEVNETLEARYADRQSEYCDGVAEAGGSVTVADESDTAAWKSAVYEDLVASWKDAATSSGLDQSVVDSFLDDYLAGVAENEGATEYEDILTACAEALG